MPIIYTNRKGRTYYLCQGLTKTGKPRYYFAREPKGEPVDEIPDGYVISESVNGNVRLAKVRQVLLLPAEVAAVEMALKRHPIKHTSIVSTSNAIELRCLSGPDQTQMSSWSG